MWEITAFADELDTTLQSRVNARHQIEPVVSRFVDELLRKEAKCIEIRVVYTGGI
jgi:hypothetical protein